MIELDLAKGIRYPCNTRGSMHLHKFPSNLPERKFPTRSYALIFIFNALPILLPSIENRKARERSVKLMPRRPA